MSGLKIARQFELPIEAVTQTFAILAKRGAGKSYTASVMVEEMLAKSLHAVVLDPLGVWWGLQSSADGERAGYPVTVLGGDHGDVPLEPTAGETIADFVVNEKQSVVIDLSSFRKADQVRFATAFCERLYQKNRDPLHLVVDEADMFAPQKAPHGQESRVLGAMEDLSRRGRARGIGMTLVTQRSAVLNKNVLTQIEVLIVMRTTSPQDRKAIKAWVDVHGEDETWNLMDRELPKLPIGTAYIWSPGWLDHFGTHAIRVRRTFDSSATPKVGERRIEPTKRAEPDLDALREKIADTIEQAKANDPVELRNTIKQLRSRVSELETQKPEAAEPEIVEVAVFPEPLKDEIRRMLTGAQISVLDHANQFAKDVEHRIENLDADFELGIEIMEAPPVAPPPRPSPVVQKPEPRTRELAQAPTPVVDSDLTPAKQRVLDSLAWLKAVGFPKPTKVQAGFIAEYRVGKNVGGTYGKILGELRAAGLIDYPDRGRVALTAEGESKANVAPIEQTTAGLQQTIYDRLSDAEERVLRVLVDEYPHALPKQDAGARAGYTVGANVGGTFGKILGTLRMLGLADYPSRGMVAATPILFID